MAHNISPPPDPNSEWKNLYQAALLETDWSKMQERIEALERAIKGRLS